LLQFSISVQQFIRFICVYTVPILTEQEEVSEPVSLLGYGGALWSRRWVQDAVRLVLVVIAVRAFSRTSKSDLLCS